MREGPARSTTESSGLLNCESLRPVSNMPVHEVVWLYLDEGETGRRDRAFVDIDKAGSPKC